MRQLTGEPCTTDRYFLGECCRYDEVRHELYWVNVDPDQGQFFRAQVDGPRITIVRHYDFEGTPTALAPMADRAEGWLVALDQSLIALSEDGTIHAMEELGSSDTPEVRTNDGAADPWGRFWIGSMANDAAEGRASLYRFHESAGVETVFENLTISNGIGWSPDERTMYFVDSGPGTIHAYDVDERGAISEPRLFVAFDIAREGTPDGLCVDEDGNVWVAVWGGYEVRQYAADGEQIASVKVDTAQPSCCALGGANGTTLYITTAQEGMSAAQLAAEPHAGQLFCCEVEVPGIPLNPYRHELRGVAHAK